MTLRQSGFLRETFCPHRFISPHGVSSLLVLLEQLSAVLTWRNPTALMVNILDQGYWKSQFPENKTKLFSKVIPGVLFKIPFLTNVRKHYFLNLLKVGLSCGQISWRNPCTLYPHLKIHPYISIVNNLQLRQFFNISFPLISPSEIRVL